VGIQQITDTNWDPLEALKKDLRLLKGKDVQNPRQGWAHVQTPRARADRGGGGGPRGPSHSIKKRKHVCTERKHFYTLSRGGEIGVVMTETN